MKTICISSKGKNEFYQLTDGEYYFITHFIHPKMAKDYIKSLNKKPKIENIKLGRIGGNNPKCISFNECSEITF